MSEFTDNALGTGAGVASFIGLKQISKKALKPYTEKIIKSMKNYSPEESKILRQATKDAFEASGLKRKGVYLHSVNNTEDVNKITKLLIKKFKIIEKNNKIFQFFGKIEKKFKEIGKKLAKKPTHAGTHNKPQIGINITNIEKSLKKSLKTLQQPHMSDSLGTVSTKYGKEMKNIINKSDLNKKIFPKPPVIKMNKKIKEVIQAVADGKNAFYHPLVKDIIINENKLPAASFHEMGHALNATGSKLMKYLAAGRHVTALIGIPLIIAVGLLKPKKKDGEKPTGIFDKTTTFIKNNAGKLTFAALIPTLAEEGIASIRGGKLAKKVLSPELLKKVNKGNFLAWTTYIAGALILSTITAMSVKIRDKVASKQK